MNKLAGPGLGGQALRFVALLLILLLLAPRLVTAVFNLLGFLTREERVPSGNPLKVEAPRLLDEPAARFK